jgi:hypothetical protein
VQSRLLWQLGVWLKNRSIEKFLVHSDRGVQYAKKFTNVIDSYKIIISRVEKLFSITVWSAFKTLKTEQIYGNKLISKEQMELDIFRCSEIWYNRKKFRFRLQNN